VIVFKIGERVIGESRATSQRTIRLLLELLASKFPGQEVTAHYPADYQPKP